MNDRFESIQFLFIEKGVKENGHFNARWQHAILTQ